MSTRLRLDNPECLCEACACFTYVTLLSNSPQRLEKLNGALERPGQDNCACEECKCETCHTDGNTSRAFCYHSQVWGDLARHMLFPTVNEALICNDCPALDEDN